MTLISIIVPVYNTEKYIERCIYSLINQSYRNIEIVIIDDGSTDKSGILCDELADIDNRIKVHHIINSGVSYARNLGVLFSIGEFVTFVDADDYVSPFYVEYLYSLLVSENADISCGRYIRTDDANYNFDNWVNNKHIVCDGRKTCDLLLGNEYMTLVTVCWKLFNRSIFLQNKFDIGKRCEDEAITAILYYGAEKVVIGEEVIYAYYDNKASYMNNSKTTINLDAVWAFEKRALFFENKKENKLAKQSWQKYIRYYIKMSSLNSGLYDVYFADFDYKNKLLLLDRILFLLYKLFPTIFSAAFKFRTY